MKIPAERNVDTVVELLDAGIKMLRKLIKDCATDFNEIEEEELVMALREIERSHELYRSSCERMRKAVESVVRRKGMDPSVLGKLMRPFDD